MDEEKWEIVRDFPDYKVSTYGVVFSLKKNVRLKPRKNSGARRVSLYKNQKPVDIYIHILVYETFIGPVGKEFKLKRRDGNESNDRLENLRAVRRSMCPSEDWTTIKGFPAYEISITGQIFSKVNAEMMKLTTNNNGYLFVNLFVDKNSIQKLVHRLVYDSFVGFKNVNSIVDHQDCNRKNNRLDNLRETDHSGNTQNRLPSKPIDNAIEQWSLDGILIRTWKTTCEIRKELGLYSS